MSKTMPWIRLYVEVLDDPKVGLLPPHLKWPWVEYLIVNEKSGGVLPPMPQLVYMLRREQAIIEAELATLVKVGLIDTNADGSLVPHNWGGRQFRGDTTNAKRQQRFKEKRRQAKAGVTAGVTVEVTPQVTEPVTPPVTPSDNATRAEQSRADSEQKQTPESPSPGSTSEPYVETQNRGGVGARKARTTAIGMRLSKDWTPSERNIADARKGPKGLGGLSAEDIEAETQAFKDWWAQAPKGAKLDWDATWRTWVKRAVEDRIRRAPRPAAGQVVAFKAKPPPRVAIEIAVASDQEWIRRMNGWRHRREWDLEVWGPNPEQRGCAAPRRLFAAAGLVPLPVMLNLGNGTPQAFDTAPLPKTEPVTAPDLLDADYSQGATP